MKKFLILSLTTLFSVNQAFAATTVAGNASVEIIAPISVASGNDLLFGSIFTDNSSGTVNQAGDVSGGVTSVPGSTKQAATFDVTGDSGAAYTFTIPGTVNTKVAIGGSVNGSGGTSPMDITLTFASGSSSRTLTGGAETVTINGSLAVGASQPVGVYTGTYEVTVNYQ